MNIIQRLFRREPLEPRGVMLEIQNGFTSFSGTAYGNAQFRAAVDAIARHAGKLKAHTGDICVNTLLTTAPNAYMSAYDMLYKTVTAYFTANNAFILVEREPDGNISAFYPLSPSSAEFIGAQGGGLYIKFTFNDRKNVTLSYSDVIHLRRHFNTNELLGADNTPLYGLLDTAETLQQGVQAAIKNAVNIRGILRFTSLVNPAQVKIEKEQFVKDYFNLSNTGGIAATDQRFDFQPTNAAPYSIPTDTLKAVNDAICAYLGVSPKIVSGEYLEDEFAAFYESAIEPLALQMSLEFSRKCGTETVFTAERLEFSSAKTRISLLRELLPFGVLTINEARQLLALPEVVDGENRLQSLNYINAAKADEYQLLTESEESEDETDTAN